MEISQISLAFFCAVSLAFGFLFGALYDVLSLLPLLFGKVYSVKLNAKLLPLQRDVKRKSARAEKLQKTALCAAVFIHDIFYTVCFGAAFAILTYVFNDGIVRALPLIAAVCGVAVYRKTVRGALLAFVELIRFGIFYAIKVTVGVLLLPFRALAMAFSRLIARGRKYADAKACARYDKKERSTLFRLAAQGFVLDSDKMINKKKGIFGYERRGKKEKNNNICDIVYVGGVGDRVCRKSDELQSAPQGSHSPRAQKRRA